jgi:hypothetical protein
MPHNPKSPANTNILTARAAQQKMFDYKGRLPESERIVLARNLSGLLQEAKALGVHKGSIVLDAGIACSSPEAASNALSKYCLRAGHQRTSPLKLSADPKKYLALALSAAKLTKKPSYDAILRLAEGSNAFGRHEQIDEDKFLPADTVWQLLRLKLVEIIRRHNLKDYFREVHEVRARYKEHLFGDEDWEQDSSHGHSTSGWPFAFLGIIVRSSVPARLEVEGINGEVGGIVQVVEGVRLLLGWEDGRVFAYLEFHPGIAVQSFEYGDHTPVFEFPWFDFHSESDTYTKGCLENLKFQLEDGASFRRPLESKDWPYRLRSHTRFEVLDPQLLASTFLDCNLVDTSKQVLDKYIDTSAVVSPANSPLALIEAQLLDRKFSYGSQCTPFLDKLEEDILMLTKSFREWRKKKREKALNDHLSALAQIEQKLNSLSVERPEQEGVRSDDT